MCVDVERRKKDYEGARGGRKVTTTTFTEDTGQRKMNGGGGGGRISRKNAKDKKGKAYSLTRR